MKTNTWQEGKIDKKKSEDQLKDCLIGDDRDRRGDRYYGNDTRTFPKY